MRISQFLEKMTANPIFVAGEEGEKECSHPQDAHSSDSLEDDKWFLYESKGAKKGQEWS